MKLKIGIFDSGIGGFTILNSLLKTRRDVEVFYLADTKRIPYGSKSFNEIRIIAKEIWGLKKLAYTIQNKNSGFYNLIEYTAPADLVSSLEVEFSRDETIMRYLTVTLDKDALAWAEKRRNRNTKKAS